MITEIPFTLKGKIYRSPMPFSDMDLSKKLWKMYLKNNVNLVVCLAGKDECFKNTGMNLIEFYKNQKMQVIHYPILDFQVPKDKKSFKEILENVIAVAEHGENIAVHCYAGIGRTGLFLACLAKLYYQLTGQEAIDCIRQTLPYAVENPKQEEFIKKF